MATLMAPGPTVTAPTTPPVSWMREMVSTVGAILELTFCSYQHYEKAYLNYFQFGRY